MPDFAVLSISAFTAAIPTKFLARRSAAAPATCGQAMDVPLLVEDWESERWLADLIELPGA